jgi:hypothetical protein
MSRRRSSGIWSGTPLNAKYKNSHIRNNLDYLDYFNYFDYNGYTLVHKGDIVDFGSNSLKDICQDTIFYTTKKEANS